ncbi:hypothetical protein PF010_g25724 [Phytophthora fragariae]|uniref:Uncharacterized protein n=1 Tax=Phytophthora fragariae TaxID=53985 RepID=A0A6G0JYT3_9STRA|nr:hypothetical protein PF010_g25724 [Phytophthora fragariae]
MWPAVATCSSSGIGAGCLGRPRPRSISTVAPVSPPAPLLPCRLPTLSAPTPRPSPVRASRRSPSGRSAHLSSWSFLGPASSPRAAGAASRTPSPPSAATAFVAAASVS